MCLKLRDDLLNTLAVDVIDAAASAAAATAAAATAAIVIYMGTTFKGFLYILIWYII